MVGTPTSPAGESVRVPIFPTLCSDEDEVDMTEMPTIVATEKRQFEKRRKYLQCLGLQPIQQFSHRKQMIEGMMICWEGPLALRRWRNHSMMIRAMMIHLIFPLGLGKNLQKRSQRKKGMWRKRRNGEILLLSHRPLPSTRSQNHWTKVRWFGMLTRQRKRILHRLHRVLRLGWVLPQTYLDLVLLDLKNLYPPTSLREKSEFRETKKMPVTHCGRNDGPRRSKSLPICDPFVQRAKSAVTTVMGWKSLSCRLSSCIGLSHQVSFPSAIDLFQHPTLCISFIIFWFDLSLSAIIFCSSARRIGFDHKEILTNTRMCVLLWFFSCIWFGVFRVCRIRSNCWHFVVVYIFFATLRWNVLVTNLPDIFDIPFQWYCRNYGCWIRIFHQKWNP